MRIHEPLNDLFATGSHVRVLRALDGLPGGAGVSGRELARRAGVSAPTAREALASMVDQGIVHVTRSLGTAAYRLNPHHVLVALVRELFARERSAGADLDRDLSEAVRRIGGVQAAYVFGSAARGDMLPGSDIDIAVTSDGPVPEETAELDAVHQKYGNRVNVIRLRSRAGAGLRERIKAEGRRLELHRTRQSAER